MQEGKKRKRSGVISSVILPLFLLIGNHIHNNKKSKSGKSNTRRGEQKMLLILFTALFSLVLLYFLKGLLKRFRAIEVLILSLFNSFLCQHINFKIFSAYDRLSVKEEIIPRVVSYLHYGLLLPLLLIWVLYFFRSKIPTVFKLMIAMVWMGIDVGSKYLLLQIGVLKSETAGWYPIVDVGITAGILLFSSIFMVRFAFILKKELVFVD